MPSTNIIKMMNQNLQLINLKQLSLRKTKRKKKRWFHRRPKLLPRRNLTNASSCARQLHAIMLSKEFVGSRTSNYLTMRMLTGTYIGLMLESSLKKYPNSDLTSASTVSQVCKLSLAKTILLVILQGLPSTTKMISTFSLRPGSCQQTQTISRPSSIRKKLRRS